MSRPEIKKKISGKNNHGYGKSLSDVHKEHIRIGVKKALTHLDIRNNRLDGIARLLGFESYNAYRKSLSRWKAYKLDVWRITKKQPLNTLENFNRRGRAGINNAYHLDHIINIYEGFKRKISPEKIARISNLRMIPWKENLIKEYKNAN